MFKTIIYILTLKKIPNLIWSSNHELNFKPKFITIFYLLFGLTLFGIGETLLVTANIGVSPWFVLHQGLSFKTSYSIGATTFIVSIFVLFLWIPLRQKPGIGTIMNAIIISIVYQSWLPLLFIVLPNFYGKTLILLFGLTQHTGLQEDIKDHRYSTRTVKLNPIFSFLYWQMEYHIEHHMFPNVPSYNLPKLHEMVKDQMPPIRKGLWGAYSEILPAIFKQAYDKDYKIPLIVPN